MDGNAGGLKKEVEKEVKTVFGEDGERCWTKKKVSPTGDRHGTGGGWSVWTALISSAGAIFSPG